MKFTDGFWLVRKGFMPVFPSEAYDVAEDAGRLVIHAPGKRIEHRGDTLNQPLLTIEISAPIENVLKVRLSHFMGERAKLPNFVLPGDPVNSGGPSGKHSQHASIAVTESEGLIRSGKLEARIPRGKTPWQIAFSAGGRRLTSSDNRAMAYIESDDGKTYVKDELSLDVGEWVYGLGERFSAFVKNGQVVDIWNRDGGTASEQAYKNIPFYMTNRGYGVFVNHPELVSFEVASEKVSRVGFSVEGQFIEYYIMYGASPKDILERYTALSGRPPLPPLWSFGLWLTTSFTTSYDEKTVTSFVEGMAERDLPLSVFHFDCFWMREFNWSDFVWDSRTFPDPAGMLKRLKARGLKICVWINPYIGQRSKLFAEGMAKGYLVKKPNGDVWQTDMWQAGMGVVDFTNPAACAWYAAALEKLLDMGVDAFKTDFGERIPTDVVWFDGSDPQRMHNFYPYIYNKAVFELLKKKRGEGEAVVFARSATAGGQIFPVHWGGDSDSSFPSMAESLRGGLSLGLSGFGFWSHDIGGFEGLPRESVFKRWLAFGLLSSHSRLHGSSSYRVPWNYGDEAVAVLKFFTNLKMQLMPYIYAAAAEATKTGTPVMRAMVLDFPNDPTCSQLDRQYMLGPDILVAPVFSEDGTAEYYLPAGTWTHLVDKSARTGPGWFREKFDYMSLPLFAREGSLVAWGSEKKRPDYDWTAEPTFVLYALAPGATARAELVDTKGRAAGVLAVSRAGERGTAATMSGNPTGLGHGGKYSIVAEGFDKLPRVVFAGVDTIEKVEGGNTAGHELGAVVEVIEPKIIVIV